MKATAMLPEAASVLLTTSANGAFRTKVNEVLLAGTLLGYYKSTGIEAIALEMEGHGRESWKASRT